ncbi:ATP-binding protein [Gloeobacter kilaueensis]|uniref:ATP-dependent metalloprotease FtsH n=1 Tax=Gloeobacter kilaueensis (strain ATCC BAA-2537 / CCAP 1431/1 / ULC 316 / JS1) TaxID=1183438 RepID=U5QGA4_GLOK1|nr:AAA family ATPase [Gloeobacter kilaueensis]AGY57951.1 ATP-dependent metalloprotease FtsH [Gloeobacter kilaueensis JS1]
MAEIHRSNPLPTPDELQRFEQAVAEGTAGYILIQGLLWSAYVAAILWGGTRLILGGLDLGLPYYTSTPLEEMLDVVGEVLAHTQLIVLEFQYATGLPWCVLGLLLIALRMFSSAHFRLRVAAEAFGEPTTPKAYLKPTLIILVTLGSIGAVLWLNCLPDAARIHGLIRTWEMARYSWRAAHPVAGISNPAQAVLFVANWAMILFWCRWLVGPLPLDYRRSRAREVKADRAWLRTIFLGAPVKFGLPRLRDFTFREVPGTGSAPEPVISTSSLGWEDLILPEPTLEHIRLTLEVLSDPDKQRLLPVPPRGMLLYGPPGTGKTQVARVIASVGNFNLYTIGTAEARGQFIGWGPARIRSIFEAARNNPPAILFIDEIDALAPNRTSFVDSGGMFADTVNELIQQMDGLSGERVFTIAATNHPERIDPAVLRRLGVDPATRLWAIEIPLPDYECRRKLLQHILKNQPLSADFDWTAIVRLSDGLSGDGLNSLCTQAGLNAIKQRRVALTTEDFFAALGHTCTS